MKSLIKICGTREKIPDNVRSMMKGVKSTRITVQFPGTTKIGDEVTYKSYV